VSSSAISPVVTPRKQATSNPGANGDDGAQPAIIVPPPRKSAAKKQNSPGGQSTTRPQPQKKAVTEQSSSSENPAPQPTHARPRSTKKAVTEQKSPSGGQTDPIPPPSRTQPRSTVVVDTPTPGDGNERADSLYRRELNTLRTRGKSGNGNGGRKEFSDPLANGLPLVNPLPTAEEKTEEKSSDPLEERTSDDSGEDKLKNSSGSKTKDTEKSNSGNKPGNDSSAAPADGNSCCSSKVVGIAGAIAAALGGMWYWKYKGQGTEVKWYENPKVIAGGIATAVLSAGAYLWGCFSNDVSSDVLDEPQSIFSRPRKSRSTKKRNRKKAKKNEGMSEMMTFIIAGILVVFSGFLIGLACLSESSELVEEFGDELV